MSSLTALLQRCAFVWAILSIGLLLRSARGTRWRDRGWGSLLPDLVLVLIMTAGMIYLFVDYEDFSRRIGFPLPEDLAIGIVYLIVALEVTRRFIGLAMVVICSLFGLQALFGPYFPGMFAAPSVRWQTFIEVLFMQDNGIFGPTAGVAASYLMIFLVFGAMLVRTNGIEFFEKLSLALLGRRPGGPDRLRCRRPAGPGGHGGAGRASGVEELGLHAQDAEHERQRGAAVGERDRHALALARSVCSWPKKDSTAAALAILIAGDFRVTR